MLMILRNHDLSIKMGNFHIFFTTGYIRLYLLRSSVHFASGLSGAVGHYTKAHANLLPRRRQPCSLSSGDGIQEPSPGFAARGK